MSKGQFPTLLNKKATMLGSLTRIDLLVLGGCYLILSWMKVSGLYALGINAFVLFIMKFTQKRLSTGFFTQIRGEKKLSWSYKLGGRYE